MEKIITVDNVGDFKIPSEIRTYLKLKKDDKLLISNSKDVIIIRKINQPSLSERFRNLSSTIAKKLQEQGLSEADALKAVQWARK